MTQEKSDKLIFDFEAVFEPVDYLYFYADILTEERTKKEIEFLVKELELDKPMKILDLPCGYGRHANRLAELGHSVTGVDITSGFLEIANREAKKKGLSVHYIQKDMREISFLNEFDRVLLLSGSFGYFDDEDNFKVLKNVSSALKQGGLFCFDTFNRDAFLKIFLPYVVVEKGNDLMIDRHTFDSATGRVYNRRIVIRNGKRKDKPFSVRLYNPTEIRDLLSRAGLSINKIHEDWGAEPFSSNSRRMIITAKKE
ncbi:class I SAM-dependent methyltransferase [Dehalococcoidia bacterium]|nr:class I SAM-dependent methyltransferase [Dehalococcoidia bacterium]MCL0079700.1 class I SAM-dependent methyltransferase [Dehalococcoidia bacterium]